MARPVSISEIVDGVNQQLAASREIVDIIRQLANLRDSTQDADAKKSLDELVGRLTDVGQLVANSSSAMAKTIETLARV